MKKSTFYLLLLIGILIVSVFGATPEEYFFPTQMDGEILVSHFNLLKPSLSGKTNYCYCETHDSRILNEKVNNGILYLGKHCLNVRGRYLGSIKCYIDIGPGIVRTDIYERYGNEIRAIVTEGPGGLDIHSTPQCVFVLPPARGEIVSWETTYGGMDSDYTAQFVDSVSTKHGTLSDVVLVTENTSADGEAISTYRRYYAKGYGLVRTEEDSEGKTNIWPSHELVKFYTKQIR